jgi:hypothetical protein
MLSRGEYRLQKGRRGTDRGRTALLRHEGHPFLARGCTMNREWDGNWQHEERRFEPALVLTLTLGIGIAAFLALVS